MRGKYIIDNLDFIDRVAIVVKALVARMFGERKGEILVRVVGELEDSIREEYRVFEVEEEVKLFRDFKKAKESAGNDTYYITVTFSIKEAEGVEIPLRGKGWLGVKVAERNGEVSFTPLWGYDVVVQQDENGMLRTAAGRIHSESFSAELGMGQHIYEALRSAVETAFTKFNADINAVLQRAALVPAEVG